ncbi:(2Fe-2S)-binding protein [Brevibacillus humidisoli]|uniref:2Fe-2S iron-sulfur cluster-binding protein n=1 Tax=Brevibacillus humidisoli TaxID=2895522 RepID=UPI001E539B0C|nr:2Fe-2S iron-sulfur cluster-binding protein [Brevibacillus humidisoli]UFJ42797.1 (2Fe-2S)-binding protein [Brevibacillus humidisoli]
METLTLVTRSGTQQLPPVIDQTIVKLAKQYKISWGYACERGICAQCRTKVVEGAEFLNDVTQEEKLRLKKTERSAGFRLGCQIQIKRPGKITLAHVPY